MIWGDYTSVCGDGDWFVMSENLTYLFLGYCAPTSTGSIKITIINWFCGAESPAFTHEVPIWENFLARTVTLLIVITYIPFMAVECERTILIDIIMFAKFILLYGRHFNNGWICYIIIKSSSLTHS